MLDVTSRTMSQKPMHKMKKENNKEEPSTLMSDSTPTIRVEAPVPKSKVASVLYSNHTVQQLQYQHQHQHQHQHIPRKSSPLAKVSSLSQDDHNEEEQDDDDDDDDDDDNVNIINGDGKMKSNETLYSNSSASTTPTARNSEDDETDSDNDNGNILNGMNGVDSEERFRGMYRLLQKSYSISNNNLVDTEKSKIRGENLKNTSPLSLVVQFNDGDDLDSESDINTVEVGHYDSRSTSISNTSNRSTLQEVVLSSDNDDDTKENDEKLSTETLIPLYVHGDHVLIFNSEDMKDLTIKYGITGQLSGTLPLAPQQNSLLGFPWRLSLYEVIWCVLEKVGVLINSDDVIKDGYLREFIQDSKKRKVIVDDLQSRLDRWREDKQREIEEQMKKLNIIRKERKVMKPLDNVLVSSASMPDLQQVLNDNEKKEREKEETKRKHREMQDKSKKNKIVFMETPTDDSRVSFLWDYLLDEYNEKNQSNVKKNLSRDLLQRIIDTEVEQMHYVNKESCYEKIWLNFIIYKYLKSQLGYYLLPGMRFGGVFVSYPGDPLRYHAQQIIETRDYYNEDIGLFKLTNRGRLATGVRKVWVIGGMKKKFSPKMNILENLNNGNSLEEKDISCFSIEWAGF